MIKQAPIYVQIASRVDARLSCIRTGSTEWRDRHELEIQRLVKEHMPSGSGFDNGTRLNLGKSTGERLVFETSFHHMNEHGYYDGWTSHVVTLTPSLVFDFTLRITGRNRNDVKDYIHDAFSTALRWQPALQEKAA